MLSNLNDDEMDQIISKYEDGEHDEEFADQDVIVQEGTHGSKMYIIKTGAAEVFTGALSDRNKVKSLEQGDYFGEMALLKDGVRNASILAKGKTTCFSLDKEEFNLIVGGVQKFMKRNAKKRR